MLRARKTVLPRDEHLSSLSVVSPEIIYIQVTLNVLVRLYLCIYVTVSKEKTISKEKRGHEFEREQVYGRI